MNINKICIRFADDRKDYVNLCDKVSFSYDDESCCFKLFVFHKGSCRSFVFDLIDSFMIY